MLPTPLHPMVVHLPLALGALMPFLALGVLLAWRRRWLPANAWLGVVLLQAVLVGSSFVAMETGENEEEMVEAVVSESLIEQHESAAEVLLWGSGSALALALLAFALPGADRKVPLAWAACLAMVVVAVLTARVGKSGGELVYRHGAASAYVNDGAPAASGDGKILARKNHEPGERDEEDDD